MNFRRDPRLIKILFVILLLIPMAWLFWQFVHNAMGEKPLERMNHRLGMIALRMLVANLAWGALLALNWFPRKFVYLRRQLGVVTFLYVCVHIVFYILKAGDFSTALTQLFENVFLIAGLLAFFILAALAATSNNWSVRRLRPRGWALLHRSVYVVIVLVVLHFVLFEKNHFTEILPLIAPLAILYLFRILPRPSTRSKTGPGL